MSTPNLSLGNVLSRLQGLKNVSGRKVMPGAEFLQDLEEPPTDVNGTSASLPKFSNFIPPAQNQPESDLGGELTPQSYDVRANTVKPPEQENNFFYNLGQSLKKSFTPSFNPNGETQIPAQENTEHQFMENNLPQGTYLHAGNRPPPSWTPEPQASPGILGALSDYVNPTKRDQRTEYNKDLMTQAQLRSQGQNPNEVLAQKHEDFKKNVIDAMKNPMQVGAYGATEEVANNPILQQEFKKYTGINFDDQIASEVSKHELAMQGVEDALNGNNTQLGELEEGIKQRILSNQASDADKYYIGLALLMPLLVGGFFGKEAALGALGGGAKGIADVLGGRQKSIKEDEAALMDINKQKTGIQEKLGNIGLEKAKLGSFVKKNLPEQPLGHLIGMHRIPFTDPKTGEQSDAFEILPGFVAESKYLNNPKGLERMEKAASELSETKTYTNQVNDLTEDVVGILNQLKDKSAWQKLHIGPLSSIIPGSLSALTDNVRWKGQMVPAGPLLENQLGILANQYAHAQDLGQLDRAAQSHMEKLFSNPTKSLLTPKDVENQIMNIRQFVQGELVNKAKNKGFIPDFILQDMNEANAPLHGKLNQREQDQRISGIEKKLAQEETKYAK